MPPCDSKILSCRPLLQMMHHMAAWLATVAGAKLWSVASPDLPQPSERRCERLGKDIDYPLDKAEGVQHCLVLPGEVMVLPDFYWHATCNLLPYTVAIGGQVWAPPANSRLDDGKFEAVPPPPSPEVEDGIAGNGRKRGLNQYQRESEEGAVEGKLIADEVRHDEL